MTKGSIGARAILAWPDRCLLTCDCLLCNEKWLVSSLFSYAVQLQSTDIKEKLDRYSLQLVPSSFTGSSVEGKCLFNGVVAAPCNVDGDASV